MLTWYHMFNSTLTGSARVWFDDLPSKSIDSYDDLEKAFLANFFQQKKCIKDPIEIHHINQRERESTKDFVQRFNAESRHVKGASECMRIYGVMHGITNPELIKRLHDNIPKSVNEMMRASSGSKKPNGPGYCTPHWFQWISYMANGTNIAASQKWGCGILNLHMDEFRGVPGGILTLRSSRIIPLECALVFGSEAKTSNAVQATEERIKVAIHPEYPEQTIAIGSTLTEEGQKALRDLFRRNLDIFAWKPTDMTGVPKVNAILQNLKKCTKKSDFKWIAKAKVSFKQIKKLIAELPTLTAPMEREELIVYLAAAREATKNISQGTNLGGFHNGSEAGLILINPEGAEFTYPLRFRFNAINNEAEYETLTAGLRIAEQMGVKNLQTNVDSRLVANQVNESYIAKEPGMIQYLEKVKTLSSSLKKSSIKQHACRNKICCSKGHTDRILLPNNARGCEKTGKGILKFAKLDKFEIADFKRWQKKMHFLLSSMNVVYVLTTPILEDVEKAIIEQLRKRAK
nr:reverse transcriptase domain-containing protein [Tanacetum cinerariifolium]